MSATLNEILDDLEDEGRLGDDDALYEAFVSWAEGTGRPLYPHQEEALVEILAGNHVIAATPTGSGKSMIALMLPLSQSAPTSASPHRRALLAVHRRGRGTPGTHARACAWRDVACRVRSPVAR